MSAKPARTGEWNFSGLADRYDYRKESAEVNGKQKKRCPVADVGKTGQNRRVELLKQHPVTHDVLDVVSHHRQHRADKEEAKVPVMKRGKREFFAGQFLFDLRGHFPRINGSGGSEWVPVRLPGSRPARQASSTPSRRRGLRQGWEPQQERRRCRSSEVESHRAMFRPVSRLYS